MKCLFCESLDIGKTTMPRSTEFNGKTFNYYKCKSCKLVFLSPLPDSSDYEKMYAPGYHEEFYFKEQNPDFSYLIHDIEPYEAQRTMLDYGCGDASFLKYFLKYGYETSGIEYTPETVNQLRTLNKNINFSTVHDFWGNSKMNNYNFIHMGDVLEHIDNPRFFLQQLKTKLDPVKGVLLVEGPLEANRNFAFFVRRAISLIINKAGNGKKAGHVPYHISFSNMKNQLQLFESSGFETLKYKIFETPWPYPSVAGKSVGVTIKYLIAKLSIAISKAFPFLKQGNRFIYIGRIRQLNV